MVLIGGFYVQPASATIEPKVANSATFNSISVSSSNWANQFKSESEMSVVSPEMAKMNIEKFLSLTPSKYREMTGKKLGLKKTIELKAAQKFLSKKMGKGTSSSDIPKGLYIVGAILGWGWLLMGLMDNWTGNDWWTNLILTALCWLPGVIHAFVKMSKYYK